jgi:hypothetical protein
MIEMVVSVHYTLVPAQHVPCSQPWMEKRRFYGVSSQSVYFSLHGRRKV